MIYIDEITGEPLKEEKMTKVDLALSSDGVEVPRTEYHEHQSRLELTNALLGGTKAMKEASTKFLPQEPKESDELYQQRIQRTYLFNAFGRTVSYLGGQVFAQPVKLLSDTPSEMRSTGIKDGIEEDIDLKGNNLDAFLKPVFEKGVADGITCILVEYPPTTTTGAISMADEKKAGLRPYWVHIPTSSIIGWRTKLENGKTIFTQLRIKEVEEIDDGAYGIKKVNRIRVLEPGKWTLFEQKTNPNNQVEWQKIGSATTTLNVIPLAVFMPGKKISDLTADPPLEDLAYMNLAHWQSMSDQMNILHFTRLPILFGRKLTDPDKLAQIEIGPNRMIHSDHIEGMLQYVEHTGSAIGEGHSHLVDLETKMAMWGLQLLMPKTGSITATEKALSSGESDSTLKSWALLFKDFVEQCLAYTALYLKKDSGGSVEVNTQFRWAQTLDSEVLLRAVQFGVLPRELVFGELQRRSIVSDQYDYADLQRMFEDENRGQTFTSNSFGTIASEILGNTKASTSVTPSRNPAGVTSPFGFKRGSGRKGM